MLKEYTIKFNPAAIDYIRGVLGRQPHDDVAFLIDSITQQVKQQQSAAVPSEAPPAKCRRARGASDGTRVG
ncbi:MAG: hypothetical protein AB7F35_06340 [Acetobacteraceae bacterium]